MTHTDLPASPESRPVANTEGSNRHPNATDYPPKPKYWAKGLGNGSGECPRCGAWWTGANTCHCTGCHRNFTSQTACDKHRAGSHERDTRHCLDPATVVHGPRSKHAGKPMLVDADRDYPCWGFAGSDVQWWGGDAA